MGAVASVMSTVLCCACTGLSCACSFMGCCIGTASSAAGGISAYTARYFYILLLGLIAVACFVLRYEADDWALHINGWDVGCSNSTSKVNVNPLSSDGWYAYCQGDSAVYRLCAAVCIFHFIHLPFALCGSGFHRGFWFWKLLLLFGGIVGFMFIPADDFNDYGFVVTAQATSFFFIVLQLFILVGWFYAWNDKWTDNVYVNGGNENCWLAMILLCSLGMYIAAFAGIALLFIGYKCSLARAITSVTVISIVLITILTLFRDRYANGEPGSILPAAGVSLYITFIAWSALELNHDLDCKPLSIQNDEDAWLQTVVSMLFLAVSMMWLASQHFNSVVGFFFWKSHC
uniref:Serine incorporator n=1 Tax=Mucochytrium quahogii TaxID=96639 RepID=A0A7S2S4F6_9STRA|mmetsp:Transcript_24651/g.53286  ORF Transcript_24651/g.53286 Transcript_24651/m.53286 type:complete len:345 (+) Transcript_24651:228-1262(+)